MFFQINVTPEKEKRVTHSSNLINTETETQFTLVLAPFQPQTRIRLESYLNTTARCCLNIKNMGKQFVNVTVTKAPPDERNILLSHSEVTVEAGSTIQLNILWTPKEIGTWRDVFQFTDNRNIKYDIVFITSVIDSKKDEGKTRKKQRNKATFSKLHRTVATNVNRNVKLYMHKSPLSKRFEIKRILSTCERSTSYVDPLIKRTKTNFVSEKFENKENISSNVKDHSGLTATPKTEEVIEYGNVHDFSAIFQSSSFNLTPSSTILHSHRKPLNIKIASLNDMEFPCHQPFTCSSASTGATSLHRGTCIAVAEHCKNMTFTNEDNGDKFEDSLSPFPKNHSNSEFSMLINNVDFAPSDTPVRDHKFSSNCYSTNNKTGNKIETDTSKLSICKPLSSFAGGSDTFNITPAKSVNNSIISEGNGTYEILASPNRSKNLDHIYPTKLSRNFAILSPVIPVTGSVCKTDLTSSSPICSSFLSTADDSLKNDPFHVSLRHIDLRSAEEILETDLSIKLSKQYKVANTREECMSLKIIMEEQPVTSGSLRNTKELNKTEILSTTNKKLINDFIEISPPKKLSCKISPIRKVASKKCSKISKGRSFHETLMLRRKIHQNTFIKNGGNMTIPGTMRTTKLSLAGINKNKIQDAPMKTYQKEVSVKLYNPNDFLTRLCNPDPFAASMTEDPFLASTLYYDEKWVNHQEVEFKKWLNALLTPPEHLTADVDTACIDVGKVWQSCRMKEDVALAETKEAVSARYHTNTRLNCLRKAACVMFRSEEVVAVLSRITVCVEKGILIIRQDRNLHRDIGLQKEVLELFLSYNPLWLRIGLEAVYGETIPLHSNNDLIGLTRFLLTRFFSDPFLVKTHSHPTVTNLKLPMFTHLINKFMLKKFLLLIYFLDYAKRNKLIGHDPCLFHKQAVYKESRAILLAFSCQVLSGIGDITKVLRPYGYVVSHRQTYLDEYNYAVINIRTDLRDGVRLCRVMELITGKRNLTCRCRVPAISRLQKVHNVDVGLTALLQSGYILTGGIDAKSVADGHREKTLSLLWQIIHKFQAPRFEKATRTVQKWWRSMLLYIQVRNVLKKRKDSAACIIQRAWKCYLARKQLKYLKEEYIQRLRKQNVAVRIIQLHWLQKKQMLQERKAFLRLRSSIMLLQKWWRNKQATESFVKTFKSKRKAVIIIQQRWRATRLTKIQKINYLKMKKATIKIQLWWKTEYERYQRKLNAVRLIQSWWKNILVLNQDRSKFVLLKNTVRLIERLWIYKRMVYKERNDFLSQRSSAIIIQRSWRRYWVTKNMVLNLKLRKNACGVIQVWWRSRIALQEYNLTKSSCLIIQRWWRSIILMKSTQATYLSIKRSTIMIQKNWKMKRTRTNYLEKRTAVLTIESWYSNINYCAMVRNDFLKMKAAARIIQRWWRDLKRFKMCRIQYLKYKETVLLLQSRWRTNIISKKTRYSYLLRKRAVCKIQAWWKMIKQRKLYLSLMNSHRAVTILQRKWRATLIKRPVRANYIKMRLCTLNVQKRWRAIKIGQFVRNEYCQKKNAANIIQKNWRMFIALRKFNEQKHAAITIQAWWKNIMLTIKIRNSFVAIRTAAIHLQRHFKIKKIALHTRQEYIKLRQNVCMVQHRWRATKIAKDIRQQYIAHRNATIVIQSNWKMIIQMRKYIIMRRAVIIIQSAWRLKSAAKKVKLYYLSLKSATILVQQRYRANKARNSVVREYNSLRRSTIQIQRIWRENRMIRMQELARKQKAAIKIQCWWKSVLLMRICQTYCEQKIAGIIIQRKFRPCVIALRTKQKYDSYRTSIIKIQKWWRQILFKKRLSKQLQICKIAVSVIENWWIEILNRKHTSNKRLVELQRKISAVILIQAAWRGYKVRQIQCTELTKLRQRSKEATKAAKPTATLGYRLDEAVTIFQSCKSLGALSRCLTALDTITRLLPKSCILICEANLVDKIYNILAQSNRSLPWIDVCLQASSILVSLAKFPPTKHYVHKEKYAETIARLLTVTVEKEVELFLHLATLLWLLAEDPQYTKAIVRCPRTVWLLSSLYTLIAKNRNRTSLRGLKSRKEVIQLPNCKPDWGVVRGQPRLFINVHHAVFAILKRLEINSLS